MQETNLMWFDFASYFKVQQWNRKVECRLHTFLLFIHKQVYLTVTFCWEITCGWKHNCIESLYYKLDAFCTLKWERRSRGCQFNFQLTQLKLLNRDKHWYSTGRQTCPRVSVPSLGGLANQVCQVCWSRQYFTHWGNNTIYQHKYPGAKRTTCVDNYIFDAKSHKMSHCNLSEMTSFWNLRV